MFNSLYVRNRYHIMYQINKNKFSDLELKQKLLDTNDEELVNHCNNQEWGVYNGKGENKLGKILMKIRKELKDGESDKSKPDTEEKSETKEE